MPRDSARADVAVIGGGLHGCSVALHCALRGLRVTLLEKDSVGRHASGVNAGGVRRLGRHPAEVPLSVAALDIWGRLADLVDEDCGFQRSSQIKVAETDAEFARLEARAAEIRALGFVHEEIIQAEELYRLLPALTPGCPGALICRDDGFADPFRTTLAFRRKAERLGVRVREGVPVHDLRRDGGGWRLETASGPIAADTVVNCAGAWAAEICARLGEEAPVEAIAPMMTVTGRLPPFIGPVVGATGRPLSFKQMANGTVLIGGGYTGVANPGQGTTRLRVPRLARNLRTAAELFPVMRGATVVRCWAGIEARMPDEIPVVGPSAVAPRVFHAFGFSAHGFQLGPIVGRILAELIDGGATDLPIAAFSIDRFQR